MGNPMAHGQFSDIPFIDVLDGSVRMPERRGESETHKDFLSGSEEMSGLNLKEFITADERDYAAGILIRSGFNKC